MILDREAGGDQVAALYLVIGLLSALRYREKTGQGQDDPLQSFVDFGTSAVSSEFPENIAYEFVKTIFKDYKRFAEFHALGRLILPAGLASSWEPKDMHPGAYKEEGIMK